MNEQIKELAEQAGFDIEQTAYGEKVFVDGRGVTKEIERFAELVDAAAVAREREACAKAMQPMLRDMISRSQAAEIIRGRTE
jgi:hypothetical protein